MCVCVCVFEREGQLFECKDINMIVPLGILVLDLMTVL